MEGLEIDAGTSEGNIFGGKEGFVFNIGFYDVDASTGGVFLSRLVKVGSGTTQEDTEAGTLGDGEPGIVGGSKGRLDAGKYGVFQGEARVIAVFEESEDLVLGRLGIRGVGVVLVRQGILELASEPDDSDSAESGVSLVADGGAGGGDSEHGRIWFGEGASFDEEHVESLGEVYHVRGANGISGGGGISLDGNESDGPENCKYCNNHNELNKGETSIGFFVWIHGRENLGFECFLVFHGRKIMKWMK